MGKSSYADKNGKSRGDGSKPASRGFEGYEFARIELTTGEKDEYKSLLAAGELDGFGLQYYADNGYKVSISKQDGDSGYIASLTGRGGNHPNAGLVLTGRGSSAVRALAVCAYKDLYLCTDGLWREALDRRRGSSEDIG